MRPPRKIPNSVPTEELVTKLESLGMRVTTAKPNPYDTAVITSVDQIIAGKAKPIVRLFYAGEQIAEVYETERGALWASVYELVTLRTIHPIDERYVSMIVGDRRRWDRLGDDGMTRSLRAAIELLEYPSPPCGPWLLATGPSGGFHRFELADVMREVRMARGNRRTQRWDVDRRPGATISRPN
jgi:hypothetical protein